MGRNIIRQSAALAMAAFGLVCPVFAHSVELVLDSVGPAQVVEFSLNGATGSSVAGVASWTRSGKAGDEWLPPSIVSFTTELNKSAAVGTRQIYQMVDVAELSKQGGVQRMGVNKVSELAELWGRHYGKITNQETAAAFQIAVWELAYDDDRDLSGGIFQALQAQGAWPAYVALAQDWLNTIDGEGPRVVLLGFSNSELDDLITTYETIVTTIRLPAAWHVPHIVSYPPWPVLDGPPVPTPTSLAGGLMLLSFFASGQLLRRRRER